MEKIRLKPFSKFCISLFVACLFAVPACRKPGPVELQDKTQSAISDVQPISSVSDFWNDSDTTGLVAADQSSYFGELVVAGVRYDSPTQSHTVSLARAIFRSSSDSIMYNGKLLGYRTLDVGGVYIDGLPLYSIPTRIKLNASGTSDTVVGVHYQLINKDGVGGRGFTFVPSHTYQWRNSSGNPVVLNVDFRSPKEVRVVRPTPLDIILQNEGLPVEWTGGEDTLRLIISVFEVGKSPIPIMRLRIQSDSKIVTIPAKIMELLPTERSSLFVFTFVSQTRSTVQANGFPDRVLVHAASIHNLLLTVRR